MTYYVPEVEAMVEDPAREVYCPSKQDTIFIQVFVSLLRHSSYQARRKSSCQETHTKRN